MISCTQAVAQLWEYLAEEVSRDDRAAIDEHLAFCRRCCGEVEFAHQLQGVLASAADVGLPRDVEQRLVTVLDQLDTLTGERSGVPPRGGDHPGGDTGGGH